MAEGNGKTLSWFDRVLIGGLVISIGSLIWGQQTTMQSMVQQDHNLLLSDRALFKELKNGLIQVNSDFTRHETQQTITVTDLYRRVTDDDKRVTDLEYRLKFLQENNPGRKP